MLRGPQSNQVPHWSRKGAACEPRCLDQRCLLLQTARGCVPSSPHPPGDTPHLAQNQQANTGPVNSPALGPRPGLRFLSMWTRQSKSLALHPPFPGVPSTHPVLPHCLLHRDDILRMAFNHSGPWESQTPAEKALFAFPAATMRR